MSYIPYRDQLEIAAKIVAMLDQGETLGRAIDDTGISYKEVLVTPAIRTAIVENTKNREAAELIIVHHFNYKRSGIIPFVY